MRRMLTALVLTLPLCLSACASYAVHLYSDPHLLQVIDERVVLTDGEETSSSDPLAVLMRGDSVVVIGERRNNWEYEQDMHDRTFIVYYNSRRSYVPFRSLVTMHQYASMFGSGGDSTTGPTRPAGPGAAAEPGGVASRDSAATVVPSGDLTGGPANGRRRGRR